MNDYKKILKKFAFNDKDYKILGFFTAAIIGLVIVVVFIQSSKVSSTDIASQSTTNASNTSADKYAVLSPATVKSKVPECSEALTFDSNGTSGPLTCPNGDLNVNEWNALATLEPSVMTLGYNPSLSTVKSDICSDVNVTLSDANTKNANVVESNVYQMSALYYGWTFSPNPSNVLSSGGC